jgi:uncharacterized protein (DUF58 family)
VTENQGVPWRPTAAHLRAALLGVAGALTAVLLRRPDVLALAVPFLVIAVWGHVTRPTRPARLSFAEAHLLATSDEPITTTSVSVRVPDGCELLVLDPPSARHVRYAQRSKSLSLALDGRRLPDQLDIAWEATRWGEHALKPTCATAYAPWLAFADSVTVRGEPVLTVTPTPLVLPALGALPTRRGLPGPNPSRIGGAGMDLAEIRPLQPGDEPRRIHWPSSSRLGELHVVATTRDVEATIELILDVTHLTDKHLDTAVALTAGLAAQLLSRGERVALTILGSGALPSLRAGRGRAQDARIRGLLARVAPGVSAVHEDFHLIRELRRHTRPADITIGIGHVQDPLVSLLTRRQRFGARTVILDIDHPAQEVPQQAPARVGMPTVIYEHPGSLLGLAPALSAYDRSGASVQ